ncbi:hypothetical protein J6590_033974 [Homalodisca vitripennis]|nr:hypothetical protein J6590_033974 [Homalodisca vitripennis]
MHSDILVHTTTGLGNTGQGVYLGNSLPDSVEVASIFKAFKTRLRRFLPSQTFYKLDEFLAQDWESDRLG